MTYRYVALVFMTLFVTACTAPAPVDRGNWQNANIPREEWGLDFAACDRYADREVRRQMGSRTIDVQTDNLGGGTAVYNQQMTAFEANRLDARLYAECLTRRGYQRGAPPRQGSSSS